MTHQGTAADVLRARIGASFTLLGAGALGWLDDTGGPLGTALFTARCVTFVLAGAGLSASLRLWWRDHRPVRVARPRTPGGAARPGPARPGITRNRPAPSGPAPASPVPSSPAPSSSARPAHPPTPPAGPAPAHGPQDLPLPGGWSWTRRGPDLLVSRPDLPTLAVRLTRDGAQPTGPETLILWQEGPDLEPALTPSGWHVTGSAAHLTRLLEVL